MDDKRLRELKKEDVYNVELNNHEKRVINKYKKEKELENGNIRIMDWGCARGDKVAYLRSKGYKAHGVDINKKYVESGKKYFEREYKNKNIIKEISKDNKSGFEEGLFDIVLSTNVFEHVENLEGVVEESSRISKRGSFHFHFFPAKYHLVESHLDMPLVHWLPKREIRKKVIKAYLRLGVKPKEGWEDMRKSGLEETAQVLYDYTVNSVYYRSNKEVRSIFESYGMSAKTISAGSPKLKKIMGPLYYFTKIKPFYVLLGRLISTFRSTALFAKSKKRK
jgi:SAM-dependent methyltransferase